MPRPEELERLAAELGLVLNVVRYGNGSRIAWITDAVTGADFGNYIYATRRHRLDGCPPANSLSDREVIKACGQLAVAKRRKGA